MKRNFVIAAVLTLFVMAMSVSAQNAPSFSGTWTLDVSKSKLGERNNIESQTLTVTQTDKDIKIANQTKRGAPPAGAPGGGRPGGGGMGGPGGPGGDNSVSYILDGKEVTIEQDSPMGKIPVKMTGKVDGGKLKLATSRTFNGPNGEITSTSKETWSLSEDGNVLTVEREMTSPRGSNSTTSVYTRKQ
jgi:hypothetical protein